MKLKSVMLGGLLALIGASTASAQTDITVGGTAYKVYNVTGATAFRSAMHLTLQSLLGGAGVTKIGYVGTVGSFNGADFVIYQGTLNSVNTIVRCSQSGSAEGVRDVSTNTAIDYIDVNADVLASLATTPFKLSNTTTIPATANLNGNASATLKTTAIPRFSFSDVAQSVTPNPTPALTGGSAVGVISFAFMTNQGTTGITNMTDQIFAQLYTQGKVAKSAFTGSSADIQSVVAMGRNSLSGTRIAVLSETKYGAFTPVRQFGSNETGFTGTAILTGTSPNQAIDTLSEVADPRGFTSGSGLRAYANATSASVTLDGVAGQNIAIVCYAGIADVDSVANHANLSTTASSSKKAQMLTYNGEIYSYDNVRNGKYTLWSEERLYGPQSPTTLETTFRTTLASNIVSNLPTAAPAIVGIKKSDMLVTRPGGDGEVVILPYSGKNCPPRVRAGVPASHSWDFSLRPVGRWEKFEQLNNIRFIVYSQTNEINS
jgi:hypothetical protein